MPTKATSGLSLPAPLGVEDRRDLAELRRGVAGYVDRNFAQIRAAGETFEAPGALQELARSAVAAFRQAAEAPGGTPGVSRGQAEVMGAAMAAVFENLAGLSWHGALDRAAAAEEALRRSGRLTDEMRVYMGRIIRLALICAERDEARLQLLVEVDEVIEAWFAWLAAVLALAAFRAAAPIVDVGDPSAELIPEPPRDHPPPLRVLEPPCAAGAALAPPLGFRHGATSWFDACCFREGLMPAA